jgi:hypothetical protein
MPPASDIEAYLTQHAHLSEAQASEVVAVTGPLLSDVGVVAATFARARSRVSDAVVRGEPRPRPGAARRSPLALTRRAAQRPS